MIQVPVRSRRVLSTARFDQSFTLDQLVSDSNPLSSHLFLNLLPNNVKLPMTSRQCHTEMTYINGYRKQDANRSLMGIVKHNI